MIAQGTQLNVKTIRSTYPDCPQREMALGLLRDGNTAQAVAWLKKLDELLQAGRSAQFSPNRQAV